MQDSVWLLLPLLYCLAAWPWWHRCHACQEGGQARGSMAAVLQQQGLGEAAARYGSGKSSSGTQGRSRWC